MACDRLRQWDGGTDKYGCWNSDVDKRITVVTVIIWFLTTVFLFHTKIKPSLISSGLFHKIIAFSGSPSTPFLHNDRAPVCYGRAFAKKLLEDQLKGYDSVTDEELLEMLKHVPTKIIGKNMTLFKDWDS